MTKIVYLKVDYKTKIPSEVMENDIFTENKTIALNLLDDEITNPETKRNAIILSLINLLIIFAILISVNNKKYLKAMILIIGIILPVVAYALCNVNIEIDLQLKIEKPCIPFNDENSWEGIINSVKNNKTECMNIGDTKTIDLGSLGTHTVRIANKSTPEECSSEEFSQTACGFVVEFADIITTHRINPISQSGSVNGDGNRGGWKHSEMRTYVNNDIYNALPSQLKSEIIDTKVVSSHGSLDSENFTTTDKIYLLGTHEVWEDTDGNLNDGIDHYDTRYNKTRQLDYYNNLGVTTSNYLETIKQNNGSNAWWWLRSASSYDYTNFFLVTENGRWLNNIFYLAGGVSPAFRLG